MNRFFKKNYFSFTKFSRNAAVHDSSSDGIEFINSDGEPIVDDDSEENCISEPTDGRSSFRSPKQEFQIMYIQMEFCEKSTLRYIQKSQCNVATGTLIN